MDLKPCFAGLQRPFRRTIQIIAVSTVEETKLQRQTGWIPTSNILYVFIYIYIYNNCELVTEAPWSQAPISCTCKAAAAQLFSPNRTAYAMFRQPRRVATKPRTLWLPRYRSHPPQRLWRLPEPNTFGRTCIVLCWKVSGSCIPWLKLHEERFPVKHGHDWSNVDISHSQNFKSFLTLSTFDQYWNGATSDDFVRMHGLLKLHQSRGDSIAPFEGFPWGTWLPLLWLMSLLIVPLNVPNVILYLRLICPL